MSCAAYHSDVFRQLVVPLVVAENGLNILSKQYEKIQHVSEDTVLSCYLNPSKQPQTRPRPETVI